MPERDGVPGRPMAPAMPAGSSPRKCWLPMMASALARSQASIAVATLAAMPPRCALACAGGVAGGVFADMLARWRFT